MTARRLRLLVLVCACGALVGSAGATVTSWNSTSNGSWATPGNWDTGQTPGANDDARHNLTSFDSRIDVTDDRSCLSFQGNGTEDSVRYLLVQATKKLTVLSGGLVANPSSDDFVVQMQSGTSSAAKTSLIVQGAVNDIDIKKASGTSGDYVSIAITSTSSDPDVTSSSIALSPGNSGDLTIDGDLIDTVLGVGNNWNIVIGASGSGGVSGTGNIERFSIGDGNNDAVADVTVNGNFANRLVTLGTAAGSASTRLRVDIDSVGSLGTGEDWTLRGFADVIVGAPVVGGDFTASANTAPVISQHNSSKIKTFGFTSKGTWDLFNTSIYEGGNEIQKGIWNLADSSQVLASDGIATDSTTTWNVNSSGNGSGTFGLSVCGSILGTGISSTFNVGTSTTAGTVNVDGECSGDIDQGKWIIKNASSSVVVGGEGEIKGTSSWVVDGGRIEADRIGTDGANHAVWALTLLNGGRLLARDDTWHLKTDPQVGSGVLSYEGTGNVYEISATGGDDQNDVGLEGQIQNVNGTSELEMKLSENGNYQVVTMPSDITALDPYDLEGVALVMKELANPAISTVEAAGPDYTCHWFGADCGIASPSNELNIPCPPPDECCVPAQPCDVVGSPVIFTNSPCLAVWGGIKVEDYGSGSLFRRTIADHHKNTPMSGDVTGGIAVYRDALYAIDISVGKNAILRNSDPLASPQDSVHIYYDDCEIECNSNISGCPASVKCNSATPPNCECGVLDMQEGKIHREAVITVYGDFDGDKGSVTDTDDLTFFNSAFPSCHNSVSAGTCPCGGGGSEPGCDAYNPLVDYNCNKIIDCTDWQAFVAYRGTSSGVNTELSCTP